VPHATGSTRENGAPAVSDRESLTVGSEGPIVLHDVHLLETHQHFDRMNIPERRPHAKGSGAFGVFEVTEDVSSYTKALVFEPGVETEVLLRFSTVAGENGSPDTWRDTRGFALRFYTSEGNYDLVGNNTPIFFLRDPMKFTHFIRSQKRLPNSGLRDATMEWDFWTNNPESAHQVTYLMGPRGLPRTWREMDGYGSHTYLWVNAEGAKHWVKYHFISQEGVHNLSNDEATQIAGENADFHRQDLFEVIAKGVFPKWNLYIQAIPYSQGKTYRFNPFDLTKTISQANYPRIKVGVNTLNRNPKNFFAEIESAAFSPSNTVPGIGLSPDRMLLGRAFAYHDAQLYRVGAHVNQLPVNSPDDATHNYAFEGEMWEDHTGNRSTYVPNSDGNSWSNEVGPTNNGWEAVGVLTREAEALRANDNNFGEAGTLTREVFSNEERNNFVQTVAGALKGVRSNVEAEAFVYWKLVNATNGERIQNTVKRKSGNGIPGVEAGGEARM
nr:catalase, MLC [Micrococcus lysodeikticus, Peptide Partial, 497 aa] [Micrococcus luteus]